MKKIVFLSAMGLDVNVSIIKRLRKVYEVYYILLMSDGKYCIGDVSLTKDVTKASDVNTFQVISDFINLNKTYIIKQYRGSFSHKMKQEFKVLNLIKSLSPDYILTDASQLCYILVRFFNRNRIISIVHDPFPHSGEKSLFRKIADTLLVRLSVRQIIFNEKQRVDFINYYKLKEYNVFNSFLSINEIIPLFKKNVKIQQHNNTLRVLFWGRISPYKGVYYLLEAAREYFNKIGDDLELKIAGKGNFNFDITQYKSYSQISIDNTYIDTEKLASYLMNCDVVVCPYTDATQSGVIMMAFALHKPVLATAVGGLPEMLEFGKLGMLIQPKSVDAIYNAFVYLMAHPEVLSNYSDEINKLYSEGSPKSWEMAVVPFIKAIQSLER